METPLEWSEDTTKLLEVIRNAPRVDSEMINNIFGLGSNGVRERAWKRILSGLAPTPYHRITARAAANPSPNQADVPPTSNH